MCPMDFASDLNFSLAWRKTKRDYNHYMNSFISSRYILDCIDSRKDSWLDEIKEKLTDDERTSYGTRIVNIPKEGYYLRPAAELHPEDLVVYSALMLEAYDDLRSAIEWSADECRFSHILLDDVTENNKWEEFERDHWTAMQEEKIMLAKEANFVIETDVSGFYENIDIERATSIFRQMTGRDKIGYALSDLLEPWAEPRKRGIPQGYGPSDLLAEIYLDGIDRRLANNDFTHVRYNDDFTLFCDSRNEAINAQNLLQKLFRQRGLNMKTGKTNVFASEEALSAYAEPESIFRQIKEEDVSTGSEDMTFEQRMEQMVGDADQMQREIVQERAQSRSTVMPYGSEEDTEEGDSISDGGRNQDPEDEDPTDTLSQTHVEAAFEEYIEDVEFEDLDIHLFRYIINRLGRVDSLIATDYCIEYVKDGHSDVRRVLHKYFSKISDKAEVADELATAIANRSCRIW